MKKILIIDYNPEIIRDMIASKIHCIYGDVADPEIIERLDRALAVCRLTDELCTPVIT